MIKGVVMKNFIKNLILLLLLMSLSGCAKKRIGPTPLREIGLQAREIMEDLQDFIIEVSSSDNNSCQMEVADNFMKKKIQYFSEHLFLAMGLENVVDAIHEVMRGDITPETATLLRSLHVEPSLYRNDGVMHALETSPQTNINKMKSELNELEEVWANCLEHGPTTREQIEAPITRLSDQEQVIKDLFVFWRDNMITVISANSCQQRIKDHLSANKTLVSFILDYYSFNSTILPAFEPINIEEDNQDMNIREAFETLPLIWNSCEVEGEILEKTDFQNKAEPLIEEMLTFWIENMIPLESNNLCQSTAKKFIEDDPNLSEIIFYLFGNNPISGGLSDHYFTPEQKETFLNDMRQKFRHITK